MASIFTPKWADLCDPLPPPLSSALIITAFLRKSRRLIVRVNTPRAAQESIRETNTEHVDRAFVAASVLETWSSWALCFSLTAGIDEEDGCDPIASPEVSLNCVFAS